MDNDSEQEVDDDIGYDPSDVAFIEWLRSKIFNYKTMDHYTMKALWTYWISTEMNEKKQSRRTLFTKEMDLETTQTNAAAKLPLLKQGEYEMWRLIIEQYFQIQDYALWDVIENGNSFKPTAQTTTNAYGTSTSMIPGAVTTEEKTQKKNDDAKTLLDSIQTRFGGNDATKKTQKTLLKLRKIVSQLAILGENISQEDLNLKFLGSLPSKWNTHVVNCNIKHKLKLSEYGLFSSPSSINEVNTVNVQVSTANSSVSTDSTLDSTANLSDATVYAFLANQPNGSQLVHEDLEQIHEDDLEEMDLKWQLALLSMRARRYYQRTGKKITINGSDTAGYDKSKVECFNCHKMGHFARECRSPRNQESRPRNHDNGNKNQDSSRRTVNVEETSSKVMVAIDGAGFDWSFMAEEEVTTNMALMAFSDSEVYNDKTCSNTCLKRFEALKTQLDNLRVEFNKSEFNLATYKRGLASVEEQLVFYKKNEKRCGYNAVPPPPTGLFALPTIDLSNSGLEEFQQPEFKGYGPKATPDALSTMVKTVHGISSHLCKRLGRESFKATWDERLEIVEVKVSSFVGISKRSPGSSISMSLTCCFNSLISLYILVIFEGSSFSSVGKQLAKSCEAKSLDSLGFKEVTKSLVNWLMSGYEGLAFIEATLALAFAFDYSNSTF
ncbi:ribonuclease H-like domain-containing protein [Tanacetum coccineum]